MRNDKLQLVEDISRIISTSDYLFMCSYKGLKVKDMSELRKSLAGAKAECKVLKNRLLKKAAEQLGLKELGAVKLTGDTAVIFGKGDVGKAAKTICDFSKKFEIFVPKMGFFDGTIIDKSGIKAVSELPSIEVLRAMLLVALSSPARNLVTILNTKASEIVNVINSYKNKLENK